MSDQARGVTSSPVLGARCTRCQRYLVDERDARRGFKGRWRHESCDTARTPSEAEFLALAEVLMDSQPWPRLLQLRSALTELDETPVARIPRQSTGPAIERDEETRLEELRERRAMLEEAIGDERSWKASRLALEWADGP